jgi:S-adenosylmethionine/arginine decarboxylase-like enzyme
MHSNLAKNIFRKRLIIEARYTANIDSEAFVSDFLVKLSHFMEMKIIAGPFISSATGKSVPLHDGYEGSMTWAESGVNTYIWTNSQFATIDIYSCKEFDSLAVIEFVKNEYKISDYTFQELPDALRRDDDRIEYTTINSVSGVFATAFIPAGTTVSYIDGQIYSSEHSSKLPNERNAIPFHKTLSRDSFNSSSVLLNHSCEPNCYVRDLFFITTIRDIQPGEQLTYSKSLFSNSESFTATPCICGAKKCLGSIMPWRELPDDVKKEYIDYTADWIIVEEIKKKISLTDIL